ncbi:hypothetical protein NL676_020683 [Syzygium grande]|nr:hypothetical protein NL676_020683 [Syzygium grande]
MGEPSPDQGLLRPVPNTGLIHPSVPDQQYEDQGITSHSSSECSSVPLGGVNDSDSEDLLEEELAVKSPPNTRSRHKASKQSLPSLSDHGYGHSGALDAMLLMAGISSARPSFLRRFLLHFWVSSREVSVAGLMVWTGHRSFLLAAGPCSFGLLQLIVTWAPSPPPCCCFRFGANAG